MRRLTAAVVTTAAVALALVGIEVSAAFDAAVRAEVVVAGEGYPLDVRRIRIVDGLRPGESYRLPTFGIRNSRDFRTAYRLVVSAGAAPGERRPPGRWFRFVPTAVVLEAGRTHAVGVRLELPRDAEPGAYAVVLGSRPGGSEGARLTFRIEPSEGTSALRRQTVSLAMWVVTVLVVVVLAFLIRVGAMNRGQASPNVTESLSDGASGRKAGRDADEPVCRRIARLAEGSHADANADHLGRDDAGC